MSANAGEVLHNCGIGENVIAGKGFTVIVYEAGMPAQLFAEGVTVMVAVTAPVPELIVVNEGTSPVPLAARPIVGFEFVQA